MNLHNQGRILYVSMADPSQPNGPGVNEREFALSLLAKFGRRVTLLIPRPGNPCPELNTDRTILYRNPRPGNVVGVVRQQFELRAKIEQLLARESFDFVVARLTFFPLGLYMARGMPVPYAVKTVGNVTRGLADKSGWKGMLLKPLARLNRFLVREVLLSACGLDACTEILVRRHAEDFGLPPERLLLCENATNVDRFFPQETSDVRSQLGFDHLEPVLGFVGGRPAERGGMELLAVAARLIGDYPRLGVVVVGSGRNHLLKRARELDLEDRAVIPGRLPYEKIPAYVNAFDVCFALDRPKRLLQVGNSYQKVRQYLACGKRVVTCFPGDSFLTREGLVRNAPADDLDSLVDATRELLGWDEETARRHQDKCVAYARRHLSTEAALNRRVDFWNRCLADARVVPAGAGDGRPKENVAA